jgi:arylsulfatase B
MTGKYPFHTGMQNFVIVVDEPWGLPLSEKVMPEYFKDAGYSTHLIGKWHLGLFKEAYTPLQRGYDTFFGYHGSHIDYFDYTHKFFGRNYSRGYDLRRNANTEWHSDGVYATDMLTKEAVAVIEQSDKKKPFFMIVNHLAPHAGNEDVPLQAKDDDIKGFEYIENPRRKVLGAMVKSLDDSVGEIVASLRRQNLLKDTIVVFYSDNGGWSYSLLI